MRHQVLTAVFDTKQSTAELNHSLTADSYVSNKPKHASLGSTPRASETSLALAASLSLARRCYCPLRDPATPPPASISKQVKQQANVSSQAAFGKPGTCPNLLPHLKRKLPLPAHLKANFVPAPKPHIHALLQSIPHLVRHHSSGPLEGSGGRCHYWRVNIASKTNKRKQRHTRVGSRVREREGGWGGGGRGGRDPTIIVIVLLARSRRGRAGTGVRLTVLAQTKNAPGAAAGSTPHTKACQVTRQRAKVPHKGVKVTDKRDNVIHTNASTSHTQTCRRRRGHKKTAPPMHRSPGKRDRTTREKENSISASQHLITSSPLPRTSSRYTRRSKHCRRAILKSTYHANFNAVLPLKAATTGHPHSTTLLQHDDGNTKKKNNPRRHPSTQANHDQLRRIHRPNSTP